MVCTVKIVAQNMRDENEGQVGTEHLVYHHVDYFILFYSVLFYFTCFIF